MRRRSDGPCVALLLRHPLADDPRCCTRVVATSLFAEPLRLALGQCQRHPVCGCLHERWTHTVWHEFSLRDRITGASCAWAAQLGNVSLAPGCAWRCAAAAGAPSRCGLSYDSTHTALCVLSSPASRDCSLHFRLAPPSAEWHAGCIRQRVRGCDGLNQRCSNSVHLWHALRKHVSCESGGRRLMAWRLMHGLLWEADFNGQAASRACPASWPMLRLPHSGPTL